MSNIKEKAYKMGRMLSNAGIPLYYCCNPEILRDQIQIRFPWCDGDVIMNPYNGDGNTPLVESYGFPWDDGDITRDVVERMAARIVHYYDEVREQEEG